MRDGKSMENKKEKKISKIKEQLERLRAKLKADDDGDNIPKSKTKPKPAPKPKHEPKPKKVNDPTETKPPKCAPALT